MGKNKRRQQQQMQQRASLIAGSKQSVQPATAVASTSGRIDSDAEGTVRRAVEALRRSDEVINSPEQGISSSGDQDGAAADPGTSSFTALAATLTPTDGGLVRSLTSKLQEAEVKLNAARRRSEEEREAFKKLAAREAKLLESERQLKTRELNAEAGFHEENRKALSLIDAQVEAAREELSEIEAAVRTERASLHVVLETERKTLQAELTRSRLELEAELDHKRQAFDLMVSARETELDQREAELTELRKALRRDRNELATEQLLLQEDSEALQAKVLRLSEARVNSMAADLLARTQERDAARDERDRLHEALRLRLEADRKFGSSSVEDILERITSLEADNTDLLRQLRARPGEEVVARNRALEAEREGFQGVIGDLRHANAQLETQVSKNRVAVSELEAIRDERKALAKANELMRAALQELQGKVDEYVEKADAKTAFPACSEMDADQDLNEPPGALKQEFKDFAVFVAGIRHRMATDPKGPRYYTERDVRAFVAGLATSRLHLLQGISGTGKTSLPLSFASAVSGGAEVVEVQAGWRDRQDLLGHYNAFEREYYETEFLKALYRAQSPAYRDRIVLIVLDEMNLSRPEQYFADLLSVLERNPSERYLNLLPSASHNPPHRLTNGRSISVPENVWFIGTANHDETTAEFADKTYDRSHIMELPTRPARFEVKSPGDRAPVSASALQQKFRDIQQKHRSDADRVKTFINSTLEEPMRERFGIAWANRLERQIEHFVPVIVAAGGTLSEAADDLIAMKILRKVRNRHDTQVADVKILRDDLASAWTKSMGPSSTPERSLAILDREIVRLGGSHGVV